jgi:hypothetical protein
MEEVKEKKANKPKEGDKVKSQGLKFTLQDAFKMVIYDSKNYKSKDKNGKDRIRNYRRYLKTGQITKDQMEKECKEYGFKLIQDAVWKLP